MTTGTCPGCGAVIELIETPRRAGCLVGYCACNGTRHAVISVKMDALANEPDNDDPADAGEFGGLDDSTIG